MENTERAFTRRTFVKQVALGGAGLALAAPAAGAPLILTPSRTRRETAGGTLAFRPYYVQRGVGPHLEGTYAYASDTKWDAFHSNIDATTAGVVISDAEGQDRFGINTRWNVEGFGSGYITADNGGEFYTLPPAGETRELNLNVELAKSRVYRNRRRMAAHRAGNGVEWAPSRKLEGYLAVSEGYMEDAEKVVGDEERRADLAQEALLHALWASETMELEKARHAIRRRGHRPDFFMGCDTKAFFLMDQDTVMDRFLELFNYATITYYSKVRWNQDFEPVRGEKRFDLRDAFFNQLTSRGITVEGRPLFWPHEAVTPEWLREMSYVELLGYVEQHVREVVGHYGDRMYAWEVVNEFHDWANATQLTPEQTIEVTRLACDVARDTAPNVHRLINNCCPFAEYVQMGQYSGGEPAKYPQRTSWEFMRDLRDAEVDFTVTGVQMYFPWRDLQDTIIHIERFEEFGRPVQLTEVGASSGPSERSVVLDLLEISQEPYVWHRPWDEELQADWLEGLYTLGYSKPWIEAVNWYDLDDDHAFIDNGGLIKSPHGEPKAAFRRLKQLQDEWKRL